MITGKMGRHERALLSMVESTFAGPDLQKQMMDFYTGIAEMLEQHASPDEVLKDPAMRLLALRLGGSLAKEFGLQDLGKDGVSGLVDKCTKIATAKVMMKGAGL